MITEPVPVATEIPAPDPIRWEHVTAPDHGHTHVYCTICRTLAGSGCRRLLRYPPGVEVALCSVCDDCATAIVSCLAGSQEPPAHQQIMWPTEPAAEQAPDADVCVTLYFDPDRPGAASMLIAVTPEPESAEREVELLDLATAGLATYVAAYRDEMRADEPAPVPAPGALLADILDPRD